MLALLILVLFFALLIGIFVRSGKALDRKTGVICPACRGNINPRATVCPRCSSNVDRVAVVNQLKRGQTRAYITAIIVVAVIAVLWILGQPAHAEPLPVPQQQHGTCPSGYLSSGSYTYLTAVEINDTINACKVMWAASEDFVATVQCINDAAPKCDY